MSLQRLVLVGGGGHASDVLQAIEAVNACSPTYEVVGILDDQMIDQARFRSRGVVQVGSVDDIDTVDARYVICVGWPSVRSALAQRIGERSEPALPIVHPRADVGTGVELGQGTVVLGNAHLSPLVCIGVHGLVSYTASIGHDTVLGDFASVLPNAAISGQVVAGRRVLVGAGSVVLEGLYLGDDARIGAGAVVVHDIPPCQTVVGVPARSSRDSGLRQEIEKTGSP